MHLDGDPHAVVGGEFAVLSPVRRYDFVPLPVENIEIVGRPGARDPVGSLRFGRVAGASGKIDNHRYAELFSQLDGLATDFAIVRGAGWVRMQRIAMAAQRADRDAMIGEDLAKFVECLRVVEHGELAMRVARIIACPQLDRVDVKSLELVENRGQRQLREQWGKDADFHA